MISLQGKLSGQLNGRSASIMVQAFRRDTGRTFRDNTLTSQTFQTIPVHKQDLLSKLINTLHTQAHYHPR